MHSSSPKSVVSKFSSVSRQLANIIMIVFINTYLDGMTTSTLIVNLTVLGNVIQVT